MILNDLINKYKGILSQAPISVLAKKIAPPIQNQVNRLSQNVGDAIRGPISPIPPRGVERVTQPVRQFTGNLVQDYIQRLPSKVGSAIRVSPVGQLTPRSPREQIGQAGNALSLALDVGTLPFAGGVAVNTARQLGKQGLKVAIKQGAKEGAKFGAAYGGLESLFTEKDQQDVRKYIQGIVTNTAIGAGVGGALGGVAGGVGFAGGKILGKIKELTSHTSEGIQQLRNLRGQWMAGQTPIKPKGMPKPQWDFQLRFNEKYGRNPYAPVYSDDLQKAFYIEAEKRVGMQARPKGADIIPEKPDVTKGRLSDVGEAIKYQLEKQGTKVNPDNTVTLYHATSPENLAKIQKEGFVKGGSTATGGMTGLDLEPSAFFGTDKKWTSETWGQNGTAPILEVKVPVEYIRQPAQNPLEVYFEGGLKRGKDGIWRPAKEPRSTFYDRLALKDYKNNVAQPPLTDVNTPENIKWFSGLQADMEKLKRSNFIESLPKDKSGKFTVDPEKELSKLLGNFNKKYGTNITREDFLSGNLPERNDLLLNRINPNIAPQPPVSDVSTQFSQRGTVPTQVAQSKLKIQPQEQMPVVASNLQGDSQATKLPSTNIAQETIEQGSIKQASRIVGENKGSPLPDIISRQPITVSEKVGLFDYIRTPDRVLKKIGLGKESDLIRQKYDDYIRELPIEIEKITKWSKQVAPESNQRIFKYLDGQKIELTPQEMKVTNEIKGYLSEWADKLKLPKEKRISNYITHIFDKDLIKKEFDPELARLIENRVAGSVYDPFTEQRLGALGYKEDTWQALDAYVKRATRKVNMDVALEQVKAKAKGLEQSQYDYVKQYVDRINMRPTKLDNLLDNTIKQLVGYKFGMRPVAQLTRTGRQAVYRGTLGLNVGSAMRNLTQGANTYAKLGEKYTTIGYLKNLMKIATGDDELQRVGVLRDEFIQDRSLNATKKVWEKLDKGLFALFEFAEKINRGSAYFGAKAQALAKGMDEQQAIEYGKKIVRDTQFTFGSVDTPPILSSDIGKLLLQFQSYTLKQGEFLGEMIAKKDLAGMVRYSLAGLALTYTFGELFGMKPSDLIPSVRFGLPPTIQAPIEVGKAIIGTKDKWGNELDPKERLQNAGKALIPFIPGGVQIKKTIEGLGDTGRGYAQTASGNVKYPVAQTPSNKVRGALFGGYNLPEAQAYKKSNTSALSTNQSNMFKIAPDRNAYYQQILDNRGKDNAIEKAKLEVENTHKSINIKDVQIYWDDEEEKVRTKTIKEKTIKETKVKKGKKAKKGKKPSFKIKTIRIPKLKLAKIKKIKIPRLKKQKNYTLKVPKIKKMKVTGRLA